MKNIVEYSKIIFRVSKIYRIFTLVFFIILFLSILEAFLTSISISSLYPILNNILSNKSFTGSFFGIKIELIPNEKLILILGILLVLKVIVTVLRNLISFYLGETIRTKLHTKILGAMLSLPFGILNSTSHGKLMEDLKGNSDRVGMLVLKILSLLSELVMVLTLLLTSFILSWESTSIILSVSMVLYFLIIKKYLRFSAFLGKSRVLEEQNLTAIFSSFINHIKDIYLMPSRKPFLRRVHKQSTKLKILRLKSKIGAFIPKPSIELIIGLSILFFSLLNIELKLINNYISGLVVVFALSYKLLNSLINFASSLYRIENSKDSFYNIFNYFELNTHIDYIEEYEGYNNSQKKLVFKKQIKIENLTFSFFDEKKFKEIPIFKDFNCILTRGKITLITGKSGVGKSTLLDLILKLYKLKSGKILYDSTNLEKINNKLLRKKIGYVTQNCNIFNGNLAQNVCLNNKYDFHKFRKIINICDLNISDEKRIILDGGRNKSGGEIKRIALARVLYNDPDIIFIDETLSSIDFQSESHILKQLKLYNYTVVIISHRKSTHKLVDKIINIK